MPRLTLKFSRNQKGVKQLGANKLFEVITDLKV